MFCKYVCVHCMYVCIVCVCVCMYCMYVCNVCIMYCCIVCMHCMYAWMDGWMYLYICTCIYVSICIFVYMCMYICWFCFMKERLCIYSHPPPYNFSFFSSPLFLIQPFSPSCPFYFAMHITNDAAFLCFILYSCRHVSKIFPGHFHQGGRRRAERGMEGRRLEEREKWKSGTGKGRKERK